MAYFEPLEERFSPPALLRLLEPDLAWLREDFESLFAELRSELRLDLLLLLREPDCFVAISNSFDGVSPITPFF